MTVPGPRTPHLRPAARGVRAARAATAILVAAACAPRTADRPPSGGSGEGGMPPAAVAPAHVGVVRPPAAGAVPEAVEATCAAVAGWWRRGPGAVVRVVDSLVTPWQSDTAVTACVVLLRQEHGTARDTGAAPDSSAASLGAGTTLARATGRGWFELVRFMADGPDGSSSRFQRGAVRCAVEQSWDGGDDSDPAYVAEDWYEESTVCWAAPGGVAVSDTAP